MPQDPSNPTGPKKEILVKPGTNPPADPNLTFTCIGRREGGRAGGVIDVELVRELSNVYERDTSNQELAKQPEMVLVEVLRYSKTKAKHELLGLKSILLLSEEAEVVTLAGYSKTTDVFEVGAVGSIGAGRAHGPCRQRLTADAGRAGSMVGTTAGTEEDSRSDQCGYGCTKRCEPACGFESSKL